MFIDKDSRYKFGSKCNNIEFGYIKDSVNKFWECRIDGDEIY